MDVRDSENEWAPDIIPKPRVEQEGATDVVTPKAKKEGVEKKEVKAAHRRAKLVLGCWIHVSNRSARTSPNGGGGMSVGDGGGVLDDGGFLGDGGFMNDGGFVDDDSSSAEAGSWAAAVGKGRWLPRRRRV